MAYEDSVIEDSNPVTVIYIGGGREYLKGTIHVLLVSLPPPFKLRRDNETTTRRLVTSCPM